MRWSVTFGVSAVAVALWIIGAGAVVHDGLSLLAVFLLAAMVAAWLFEQRAQR